MTEPTSIFPRAVEMQAFRWDGSETGAQAIALWLAGMDGKAAWHSIRYYRRSGSDPLLLLSAEDTVPGDETEVRAGEWIIRAYGNTMVCDQATFDYNFTAAPTLRILES